MNIAWFYTLYYFVIYFKSLELNLHCSTSFYTDNKLRMIDAGSRNNAIEELINEGNKLCPKFFPTILPPLFNLLRPIDLFNADVINNNFPDLFLTPARFSTTISHSKMEIIITKITVTQLFV